MSSNLKVNTILPSTGTNVAIGTAGGSVTMVGNVDIDINSGISTFNDIHISDKIVHEGDTNTAIRFPATDTITAETGGSERVRIASDGKVRFGSGSPAYTFEIQNSGNIEFLLGSTNAGGASIIFDGDANGDGGGGDYAQIFHDTSGDMNYRARGGSGASNHIFLTGTAEKLRINSSGNVKLPDSSEIQFGGALNSGSGDLRLYHNGSNSYLTNVTGNMVIDNSSGVDMYINSGNDIYIRPQGTENGIKVIGDGAVELHHNGTRTFATEDNGAYIYGPEGGIAQLMLYADEGDDNPDKWRMAAASDESAFRLYNFNDGGWETSIKALGSGAVELYHNNARKLRTLSNGVELDDNFYLLDGKQIRLGSGEDFRFYHVGGSHNYITSEGSSQDIYIQGKRDIYIKAGDNAGGSHTSIYCDNNGGVRLSYDNVPKLYTKPHGVTIESTGSTSSDLYIAATGSGDARIYLDASNGDMSGADYAYIKMEDGTSGSDLTIANMQAGSIKFNVGAGAGGVGDAFEIKSTGYAEFAGASDLRLTLGSQGTAGTNDSNWLRASGANLMYNAASGYHLWEVGGTERFRIDSGGRLLIGTQRTYGDQNYYDDITINNSNGSAASGGTGITLISDAGSWGAFLFGDENDHDVGAIKYSHGSNFMQFRVNGDERLRIESNGALQTKNRSDQTFGLQVNDEFGVWGSNTGLAPNTTRTWTITNSSYGWGRFAIGGGDGNYQRAACIIDFGGVMWSTTKAYYHNEIVKSSSGASISTTYNNGSIVISVTAGSNWWYYTANFLQGRRDSSSWATITQG